MSEKGGDGGQDTVSLPPTYAPSETYTESPPPAYRGAKNGKMVQVVRLLCVTAVVLALLIGFFVLSTHYMKTRACTCDPRPLDTEGAQAAFLQAGILPVLPPSAQPLVKEEEVKENILHAGEDPSLGEELPQVAETELQPEQEEQLNTLLEEVEREVEEEEKLLEEEMNREDEEQKATLKDILEAQAEHMKKIRLPLDLIFGNNPNMAGREVSCEVERRQVPVAPGIVSQTILVTCKDTDDDKPDDIQGGAAPFPLPSRPLPRQGPPMSLLAPIMKMLTSRPGPQPRLVPISLRGPIPLIAQPRPASPQQIMIKPFPVSLGKPRMAPVSIRGPVSMVAPRKEAPSDRMLPRHLQPVVRVSPRFISAPRSELSPPAPISLLGLQRGALPMPQARPRAPPRPVSLSAPFPQRSPIPAAFLPFNAIPELQSRPQPRPEPRPATHMEMNEDPTPPRMDFGPPRGHTLISGPRDTPSDAMTRTIRITNLPTNPQPPPPFPPQPPRYAPEPLRSPNPPEVNPEAEVIAPPQPPQESGPAPPRKHHLLMVN